jgi:hypothetical protein
MHDFTGIGHQHPDRNAARIAGDRVRLVLLSLFDERT